MIFTFSDDATKFATLDWDGATATGEITGVDAETSTPSSELEVWVKDCSIDSEYGSAFSEADARAVAGGISRQRSRKLIWSPQVGLVRGALVVHPLSPNEPALLKCKLPTSSLKDKNFVFTARASDAEPGNLVRIFSKGGSCPRRNSQRTGIHRKCLVPKRRPSRRGWKSSSTPWAGIANTSTSTLPA